MDHTNHRILLFDIDGTLLDPAGEGRVYFLRALEDVYGVKVSMDDFDLAGKTDWQILTEVMRRSGLSDEQIEARRVDVFTAYTRRFAFSAKQSKMIPLPGVKQLLNALNNDDQFILGLVTGNVREVVPLKLKTVGLDPLVFKFGAYGSEHIDRNTLPALALYRLREILGQPVPLEHVLVIGDTPLDIACARHANLKAMGVATGHFPVEVLGDHNPDYLLEDLSDTDSVMEILRGF